MICGLLACCSASAGSEQTPAPFEGPEGGIPIHFGLCTLSSAPPLVSSLCGSGAESLPVNSLAFAAMCACRCIAGRIRAHKLQKCCVSGSIHHHSKIWAQSCMQPSICFRVWCRYSFLCCLRSQHRCCKLSNAALTSIAKLGGRLTRLHAFSITGLLGKSCSDTESSWSEGLILNVLPSQARVAVSCVQKCCRMHSFCLFVQPASKALLGHVFQDNILRLVSQDLRNIQMTCDMWGCVVSLNIVRCCLGKGLVPMHAVLNEPCPFLM